MKRNKVSEFSEQIRGVSYKPTDLHDSLNEKSIILLRANNISEGYINFDDVVYVDKSKVSEKQLLKTGDILVCASSGSKHLVGKAAQVDFEGEYTFGAFCKVVRPKNIDTDYLGMYFQSGEYRRTISAISQGANINNIKNENIDDLPIKVPDEYKQASISRILKSVSEIIRLRKVQLNFLDELIKSRFVEMFGMPHEKRFETKTLSDITTSDKNSLKRGPFGGSLKKEDFVEKGYLVYEQRHAIHNDFEYEKYYITAEKYQEMIMFKVVPGDLLVSCSGVTLGRIAEVPQGAKEGIINQALLKISLNQELMSNMFFITLFRNEEIQDILFGFSRGSGIPNFPSMNEVKAVEFICPPIDLQNQFSSFVQQVDKLKFEIQKSLDETKTLFDSLMQQYFG